MRTIASGLLALTVLLTLPALAAAQGEDHGWSAETGLSLQASGGNENLTVFTTSVGLTRLQTDVYEADFSGRLRYGETGGRKEAHNLRGDLSFDLWPEAAWSPFLFTTGEQDPIKKLELRLNGGFGAKHTFWEEGWNEVSLSGAVLYSYENLEVADSLGNGVTQTARWSWRVRGRREIGAASRLEQTIFFQPAWDQLKDYQLESITTVRVALSERLSYTTTLLYQRDNTPAPEVKPDDYSLTVGLSMATQW
jgi:hypothetical protein